MVIWAVMLFIAGCVIADNVREYEDKKICDILKYFNSDARCGHLIAATVSLSRDYSSRANKSSLFRPLFINVVSIFLVYCFIASILFAVDAFFKFRILRGQSDSSSATASAPETTST